MAKSNLHRYSVQEALNIQTGGGGYDGDAFQATGFGFPWSTPNTVLAIRIGAGRQGYYEVDPEAWKYPIQLGWNNCWSFGNGVESDRIRDDYNAPQLDNGIKVSSTFAGYKKENKTSGMIYSGLYNSTSEVNDLNEFNMAEKITKDLNPSYGSIQAMKTRDTDMVVLTEDKVLKVLANKDAVFNADGNSQLTATNRVLGTATPFSGDYGISNNPESLAWDQYRIYFTDTQRGPVLRLSMDGVTPISNVGMKTWFRDNLRNTNLAIGSFDIVNGEYNITLKDSNTDSNSTDTTVSFNEGSKGWVSFKSFIPQNGVSVSGKYMTGVNCDIYEHYRDFEIDGVTPTLYNNFYGDQYNSTINILFNEMPGTVKSFKTLNYEGSQAKVIQELSDYDYYNLTSKEGWYATIQTDLASGNVGEFIEKENKWFNRIAGTSTSIGNLDTEEFTVQGIGQPLFAFSDDYIGQFFPYELNVINDPEDSPDTPTGDNSDYYNTED